MKNVLNQIILTRLSLLSIAAIFPCIAVAQFNQPWQGKKCAVVLTYDDALPQHIDNAIPVLDSLGLKATFYLTAYFAKDRLEDWKKVTQKGHELGNHTLYHPCEGDRPGREFVSPDYNLNHYTVKRMVDEIKMTNVFLQALDSKTQRTFAFPCADLKIKDTNYINQLKNDFLAARNVRNEMHKINEVDLYNVDCYLVNNHTADQMIEWVKKAEASNSLLVILFHGVGGGNSLNVSIDDHRKFLQYLKQKEKDILIAPMIDIANHVKDWQVRDSARAATQKATQQDYNHMLKQLGITSTRPGPSGNPQAPNAANTDESKASPYTSLPDPLVLNNGQIVTDAKTWWNKRRPEIIEAFDKEVYGRTPKKTPMVKWEVISTTNEWNGNFSVITKKLLGHVDNSAYPGITVNIELNLSIPEDVKTPVPVIMEFGFISPPPAGTQREPSGRPLTWQQQLLAKGWGYATIVPTSYQADNGAGLAKGIIGLVNKGQPRKPDDWGTLKAWVWGASRALDYFETDKAVDAKRVGIEGLSRYGKATLVAMAYDQRFAIGFIGSSGAGGAKYAGPLTPNDLPVDAHELIALCAPRPVFISVGSPTVEGQWIDAKGMFVAAVNAGPVYRMMGRKDLGVTEMPPIESALTEGEIAFRQHSGGHTTVPNWPTFIIYASRYLKK